MASRRRHDGMNERKSSSGEAMNPRRDKWRPFFPSRVESGVPDEHSVNLEPVFGGFGDDMITDHLEDIMTTANLNG